MSKICSSMCLQMSWNLGRGDVPSADRELTTQSSIFFQSFLGHKYFWITLCWPEDITQNSRRDLAAPQGLLNKGFLSNVTCPLTRDGNRRIVTKIWIDIRWNGIFKNIGLIGFIFKTWTKAEKSVGRRCRKYGTRHVGVCIGIATKWSSAGASADWNN